MRLKAGKPRVQLWDGRDIIHPDIVTRAHAEGYKADQVSPYLGMALRQQASEAVIYESGALLLFTFFEAQPIDRGARTIEVPYYRLVGKSQPLGPAGNEALPQAEVEAGYQTFKPLSHGIEYGYSLEEQWAAAFAARNGVEAPFIENKALAARTAIDQFHDEKGSVGDAANNVGGILSSSLVSSETIASPWATVAPTDPQDVLDDLRVAHDNFDAAAGNTIKPDRLLLPPTTKRALDTTVFPANTDSTLTQWILKTFPNLQSIDEWPRCTGAGPGGVNRGLLYRSGNRGARVFVAVLFEQGAPEQQKFRTSIPCIGRTGGGGWVRPWYGRYLNGV